MSKATGKPYWVLVHGVRGEKLCVDLCNTEEEMQTMTVKQLKVKIYEQLPQSTGFQTLRFIFCDRQLYDDSSLLSSYGVKHRSVIHLVMKVPGGGGGGGGGPEPGPTPPFPPPSPPPRSSSLDRLTDF